MDEPSKKLPPQESATRAVPASEPAPRMPASIPDHVLLKCIGRGSYGEVWLARNMMGHFRAVKVVYRSSFKDQRPFDRELSGIRKFEPISRSYDGFVDVLHVGINEDAGYFYYVMELGDDQQAGQNIDPDTYFPQTLSRQIAVHGRLPFKDCLQLGLALSQALAELHKHGLVHRDIKPSNVVFVNGVPKLADIGLVADVNEARSYVGTEGFIPPEGPGAPQADVYSLGKVLYECSTGKDRQDFPELPTQLEQLPDYQKFLELNEVILNACRNDRDQRYQSAWDMHADLLVLANGKSVKRLKQLERRLIRLKRAAGFSAIAVLAVAGVLFEVYREWRNHVEAHNLQVEAYVSRGEQAVKSGDLFTSFARFVDALDFDQRSDERKPFHQLRVESVLRQCPKLVQGWFGTNRLNSASFSPDGSRVLIAANARKAQVMDVVTGSALSPHFGPGYLWKGTFGPRGDEVMLSSFGIEAPGVSIWRVADATPLAWFDFTNQFPAAAMSPDGKLIVTGGVGGSPKIWDTRTRTVLRILEGPARTNQFVAFSRDNRRIVTCEDDTVQIWNAEDGMPAGPPLLHAAWVNAADFSPDGTKVVTGCRDGKARVWDWKTGQLIFPVMSHQGQVMSSVYGPDGRFILTASEDGTARLWRADEHGPAMPNAIFRHSDKVMDAVFAPDGHRIATVCADGSALIFDLAGTATSGMPMPDAFSDDGGRFVSVTTNEFVVRDADSGRAISPQIKAQFPMSEVKLNPNGRFAVTLSSPFAVTNRVQQAIEVWEATTGRRHGVPVFVDAAPRLAGFVVSHNGERLLTFDAATTAIWNVANGALLARRPTEGRMPVFSPDDSMIAMRNDSVLIVWNSSTGENRFPPLIHPLALKDVEFSSDSSKLVTCFGNQTFTKAWAQIWDARTGGAIGSPLRHNGKVNSAIFSPDNSRVLTAGNDAKAIVWNAADGRPVLTLDHDSYVQSAAFSADQKFIVTVATDNTVRIWNAENGDLLMPPVEFQSRLVRAQFTPGGDRLAIADAEHKTWLFDVPVRARPLEALKKLRQLLIGDIGAPGQRADLWNYLHAKYPSWFSTSESEAIAWHEFQERQCEQERNDFAAAFHLKQLLLLEPGDPDLQRRSKAVEERLAAPARQFGLR
jgi:WD40 repeat protein